MRSCAYLDRPCTSRRRWRCALGLSAGWAFLCFPCYVRARELRGRLLVAAALVLFAVVVRVLS